jgi:hypothetical protein
MVVQKATFLLLFLILTLRRAVQFSNELVIMSQQQKRISITPCITSLFIYFVCLLFLNFLTVEEKKEIALWWGKMLSRTFFYYMRKSILDIVPVFPSSSESRLQLPHTHGNQSIIISKKYLTQLSYWLTIISK